MKNFIFDLGAVLLQWNPQAIVRAFTADKAQQALLLKEVYEHDDWHKMDRGQLSEANFTSRLSNRLGLNAGHIEALLFQTKESLLPITDTEALLYQAHGKQLYCLSNMSVETYDHIKHKVPFFDRFAGIVISGREKMAKPSPAIFSLLLERFSLAPEETVFIDDSKANVETARTLGIHSIQFDQSRECYASIRTLLAGPG